MRVTRTVRLGDLGIELGRLPQAITEAAFEALTCTRMVEMAKIYCPVDTGALMESIRAERRGPYATAIIAGGGGVINPRTGREVDYAGYVHDGTSRMAPRPFLLQGIISETRSFADELIKLTGEAL